MSDFCCKKCDGLIPRPNTSQSYSGHLCRCAPAPAGGEFKDGLEEKLDALFPKCTARRGDALVLFAHAQVLHGKSLAAAIARVRAEVWGKAHEAASAEVQKLIDSSLAGGGIEDALEARGGNKVQMALLRAHQADLTKLTETK